MKRKNDSRIFLSIILWCIVFSLVGVIIMYLFTLAGANSILTILKIKDYWLSVGVANGLIVIGFLMMYKIDAQDIALDENDLEDTKWLTEKKLKKMKEFSVSNINEIKDKKDGIVIGAKKKKGNVEVIQTSQLHALIVGTTGSGKTTGFVDQNIAILSKSKEKPGLVITDPKKELYEKHSNSLKKEGYNISVLDLREPYFSVKWNPMNVLIRRIRLIKEIEFHINHIDGKYYAGGEVFLSYHDAILRKQELKDEIFENAMDLVYTICPVQNKDQPTWEEGARNLILGFVLALCEDCIKGKIEESQLVLFNVYHNITKYCSEDTTALKSYLLEGREEFSKVKGLVNTVLITSSKTLTSYLADVNRYMQQLTDDGILSLTSANELDIVNLDEEPNAVFIVIPDERATRHRFVTLFITQMYKELVEKANLNLRRKETDTAILKRNTYFVLDEFGNLPEFPSIDNMVTVARSRGIRFLFVLQSFSQLNLKYGKEKADVIKTNCNVKIFIGSDDLDTRKEFSELCGNKKIKNFSVNTTVEHSASSSTGATNQPLITVGMLERLNGNEKGDAIVSVRGYEPIWTTFTPSFKLTKIYFPKGKVEEEKQKPNIFEKNKIVFDILGDSEKDIEDKKMNEIELREEEYLRIEEAEKKKRQSEKWGEIVNLIDLEIDKVEGILNGADMKVLRDISYENKSTFLYLLAEKYVAFKGDLNVAAENISKKFISKDKKEESLENQK